jgi:hypothetical protein
MNTERNHLMKKILGILVIAGYLLSACTTATPSQSGNDAAPSETPAGELATATDVPASPTPTSTQTPEPSPTPVPPTATPEPTATPLPVGPEAFPAGINPLTGLPVADASLLEQRPVGVKINIYPRSQYRPNWGISLADIVYDYYHNNGYTRFHAIFYGNQAELTGGVRSGRLLDEDLVQMYKSIFVYGGADNRVDRYFWDAFPERLVREGVESLCPPTDEKPLCRYDPNGISNLLAGIPEVHAYIQNKGVDDSAQNLDGMLFDLAVPANGQAGSQVTTRYSSDSYNRWEYNPETGSYLRFQDNQLDSGEGEVFAPLTDRVTETQVSAENVVIVFASHENTVPGAQTEIFDITLSGSGKALAFRDGQAYEVQWNRPAVDSVLYLTFPDGSRYPYKPGKTWYQVVGLYSKANLEESGSWRLTFGIP